MRLVSSTRHSFSGALSIVVLLVVVSGTFSASLPSSAGPDPNQAYDLDDNKKVDAGDLLFMATFMSRGAVNGDFNGDGKTDAADLFLLSRKWGIRLAPDGSLPPDPGTVAPPIASTTSSSLADRTEFLYTGETPIQTGVESGTINVTHVAVLRGKVLSRDNQPLPGVAITVLGHPEYGRTLSRKDGVFDLAVNGGGSLTVSYQKEGYLPAQRKVNTPWQDYVWLPDVVLSPVDSRVTPIDLSANVIQVAQGSVVIDEDGTRQATLLFPQDTHAELVMPDGSTQPITSLSVRATEYSVGPDGLNAMPAELPPNTGYTYCVEFTVDEAAGAKDIRFNRAVFSYVENFLNFPVGGIVPSGYYDRNRGMWVPSENGRVIRIVGVSANGLADLDIDGSGQAADATALTGLGATDAERKRLAELYRPGQSLWRVPVTHFSPQDYNWPFGPPEDAKPPDQPEPESDDQEEDPCQESGSVISVQNQVLGESVAIVGTPFSLNYTSDRVRGRSAAYTLGIPLSGESVQPSLKRIDLEVSVAGQLFSRQYPPTVGLGQPFTWNGQDAYGRTLYGQQPATIRIGYVYQGVYMEPAQVQASFGRFSGVPITGSETRQQVTLWRQRVRSIGLWDARSVGLGGWTLSVQHAYDLASRTLYLGDGRKRRAESLGKVITTEAGIDPSDFDSSQGGDGFFGDGGPATKALLLFPQGVAVGPDGSLYIAQANFVRRVDPDGIISTVVGTLNPGGGEGPFSEEQLLMPSGIAVGPDASLYISDMLNNCVLRVGRDGTVITVAGRRGTAADIIPHMGEPIGDDGPATEAWLFVPRGVAVGPGGSLYIADSGHHRVRQVSSDGIITTVAGTGQSDFGGDGGPAMNGHLDTPWGMAVGPEGSLYIADTGNSRIRRVGPDGIITTLAGTGESGFDGDGGPAIDAQLDTPSGVAVGPDGSLYIADSGNNRIRRIGQDGIITTVVGNGIEGFSGDGGPATKAQLSGPFGVASGPDGSLHVADTGNDRIRRVAPALPGLSLGGFVIPAEDGSEIYFFDPTGHHFKTVDALTGALLYNFTYNSAGQLASVQDVYGNTTTIERNAIGDPTAIVSPFGQRTALSLDAVGFLATITNPANEMHSFTYKSAGLLATMTDPRNNTWRFEYDDLGRLIRDEDPAGGFQTLARAQVPYGYEVTRTTALGTTTTYRVEHLPTGETRLVNTLPCCGVKTEVLIGTDGTRIITLADGTVVTQAEGPDPRFGMLSPLVTSASITTPAGLEANMMVSRTTGLDDPTDPTSLQKLTDSTSINGRIYTAVFETSLRQLAQTGPEGLQSTITFDHQGRPLEVRPDSRLDPLRFDYDTRGNLTKALWGGDSLTLDYDPQGRLASETDAALSQTEYTYDDANRVTQLKLPGGRLYQFTYDTAGNLTAVIAPSGAVHGFGYTAANLEESYTAPGGMSYLTTYDKERRVSAYALPSRRTTSTTYDAGGRVQQISYPEATVSFTYQDATARPTAITRIPSGAGSSQTVALAYDAFLQTEKTWRGIANGTYRYRYDNNFFPVGMTFDNDLEIPLTRDDDGLVVQYGPFTISRGGPIGAPVRIEDGNLNISYEYDSWGRLARRTHTVNGQVIYDIQLTYGNTRRIIQKVESVRGTTHTYSYGYDQDGQLVEVTRDGVIVEEYSYDPHGNRATRRLGSAPEEALTYDPRDRLTKRGNTSYRFDDDGFLVSRGTDAFEYSAVGELLSAVLGGAQSVAYTYDAFNCPVGRTDAGGIYQYFYGDVDRFYLLTASRDPVGALSIYYYDDTEHLFAMERGGTRYYVGSDQVGTPLIVTDPTGQTAKLLQYDSFGNLITDTNPGFDLPIGFAGGISDRKTELTRFGARNYEPEAGRWTALDPLLLEGDELNFYVYVGNDPINWRDPTGLQRWAPPPKPRPKAPRPLKEYEKTVKNAEETTPEVEKTGNKVKKAWQQSCGALAGEE